VREQGIAADFTTSFLVMVMRAGHASLTTVYYTLSTATCTLYACTALHCIYVHRTYTAAAVSAC
jgi:hypothetical protein